MNENPWRVDDIARMQRGRLQEEMRQIRREDKALRSRAKASGLVERLRAAVLAWLKAQATAPAHPVHARRPLKLAHSRHHSRM